MMIKQVAQIVGISRSQLTKLIRKGVLKARKVTNPIVRHGFHYEVSEKDLEEFQKTWKPKKGFPRGESRDGLRGTRLEEEINNAETSKKTTRSKTVPKKKRKPKKKGAKKI